MAFEARRDAGAKRSLRLGSSEASCSGGEGELALDLGAIEQPVSDQSAEAERSLVERVISLAWFGSGDAGGFAAESGTGVRAADSRRDLVDSAGRFEVRFGRPEQHGDPGRDLGEGNVIGDPIGDTVNAGAWCDEVAAYAAGIDEGAKAASGVPQEGAVGGLAVIEVGAAAGCGDGQGAREVAALGERAKRLDPVSGPVGAGFGGVEVDGEDAAGLAGDCDVAVAAGEPALEGARAARSRVAAFCQLPVRAGVLPPGTRGKRG